MVVPASTIQAPSLPVAVSQTAPTCHAATTSRPVQSEPWIGSPLHVPVWGSEWWHAEPSQLGVCDDSYLGVPAMEDATQHIDSASVSHQPAINTYDGTSSFKDFIVQFDIIAAFLKWDNYEIRKLFISYPL